MNSHTPPAKIMIVIATLVILALSSPAGSPVETDGALQTPIRSIGGSVVSGDQYGGSGDWVITQPTEVTSDTVIVNGDILIQDGGALILDSANVRFNVSNAVLNVTEGGFLKGHNSYLDAEGSAFVISGEYNISLHGNVSWTGGYIRHFNGISMESSDLNVTFIDTDFSFGIGQISIQGHSVAFMDCDFYDIECMEDWYLLDTTGVGVTLPGGLLIEGCRFGIPDYHPAPEALRGLIWAGNVLGNLEIVSNLFYEIDAHGGTAGTIIRIDSMIGDSILSNNRFIRCGPFLWRVVAINNDNCLVSENRFFGNTRYHPSTEYVLNVAGEDIVVERNLFWGNQFGSNIRMHSESGVIRWNTIIEGSGTGINLDGSSSNCQVYGNALYSNNLGILIHEDSSNHEIYLNALIDNELHAVDYNGTTTWDNGTYGNFWDNNTELPDENWISASFSPHHTITDEKPSFMIGTLPPASGTWEIDIPHVFAVNDLTIDGDVIVTGPTGSLVLASNKLESGHDREFEFGESTMFWLQEAEITTSDPSHNIRSFSFTDVLRFGGYRARISNVRRYYSYDSFMVSAVSVHIHMSNFTNLPHFEIDMASDYRLNYGQPMGMCTIQDTIFMELGNPHHAGGGLSVDWPNLDFRNNTIHASVPGKEVRLSSAYEAGIPGWGPYMKAEGCTIINASLNVTAIGYESLVNITNCEVDEGIMAYSAYNGISPTDLYIVGNTINSGGLDARGIEWPWPNYVTLTLEDNRIMGRTDLERISSGNIVNNTFYDIHNALVIQDSAQLIIHNNTLDGDLFLTDCDQFQITDSRLAIVEFIGSESMSFENCIFNSTGHMYFHSSAGIPNRHITFDNCTFDGLYWALVNNDDCEFLTFFDCTFYKTGFALGTYNLVNNATVDSCRFFLDSGNAVDFRGHNATVTNNIIVGSGDTAIRLNDENRGNNTIVNGNRIESFIGNGIRVRNRYSSIIEGNVIYDCFGSGILAEVGNYSVISNNMVDSAAATGISVWRFDTGGNRFFISVMNNTVSNCGAYGLYVRTIGNSLIYNNTIVNNDNYGLRVINCDDSQFWMNVLYHNEYGNINPQGSNHFFDNGTIGNFWGPSGPDGSEYCDSYYDGGPNPWIGDVPYQLSAVYDLYDDHPMLLSNPDYLPYSNVITTPMYIGEFLYVLNTTVYCEDGIHIFGVGDLILIGTRVTFQDDGSFTQLITVEDGGSLTLMGGAKLTASQTTNTYGFVLRSGSSLVIDNAHISRCGYGTGNPGLLVNTTSVSINELTVFDAPVGMVLSQGGMDIGNITFIDCDVGLRIIDSDLCTISFLEFRNVGTGVRLESGQECYFTNINFTGCNELGLYINTPGNYIVDNLFGHISGTALNISSGGNSIYLNAFIENGYHIEHNEMYPNAYHNGTHGNFYFDYEGVDDSGNLIGDTPYSSSISDVVDPYPVMVYGSFPTPDGWTIDRPTAVLNTNYTISGNVDIHEMLVLVNTRLWLNSTDSITHTITVHSIGDLIVAGAILRAINSSYRFIMIAEAQSYVYLFDANLVGLERFDLHTANIAIENTTFTDINHGLRLLGSGILDPLLENCTVNIALGDGLYIGSNAQNITIRYWVFHSVDTAIRVDGSTDIFIANIVVDTCSRGVHYTNTKGTMSITDSEFYRAQDAIYCHTAELLVVDGVHGYEIESLGILVRSTDSVTILNSHIEMTGSGTCYSIYYEVQWYLISNSHGFNATRGVWIQPRWDDEGTRGMVTGSEFRNCTTGVEFYGHDHIVYLNVTDTFFYGCDTGFWGQRHGAIRVTENEFLYSGTAIDAYNLYGSVFENNEIRNSEYGFFTDNNDFHDCLIAGNSYFDVDYPIYIEGSQSDFTIADEFILNCIMGIHFSGYALTENVSILNVEIVGSTEFAVNLYRCRNITLFGLTIEDFADGVMVHSSEMIYLNQSTITNGEYGVRITYSTVIMRDCVISGISGQGIRYDTPWWAPIGYIDIDLSNTLEGLPVYSLYNVTDEVLSGFETYHLAILHSSNVTIVSCTLHRMDKLSIRWSDNITITNSTIECDVFIYSDDIMFIGNFFESAEMIEIESRMDSSYVTMYGNAFRTQYLISRGFSSAAFKLNGTDYGNYWYNYEGIDTDGDGIGDDPFWVSGAGAYDYLPLVVDPHAYSVSIDIIHPSDEDAISGLLVVSVEVRVVTGIHYEGEPSVDTVITLNETIIFTEGAGEFSFEYDTSQLSDGFYIFRVTTTVDFVDEFIQEIQIKIDNTPPVLEPSIEDETVTSDSWPYWSIGASDALSDLRWIAVFLDGAEVKNETQYSASELMYFSLNLYEERSYQLCFQAMDELGNLAEMNLTIYYDATPPQLSSPDDVSYEYGTTGNTINWEASDLTPRFYNVTLDGAHWEDGEWDGSSITINVDGLSPGQYTVEITVHDRVGHSSSDSVQVTVTEETTPTDTTTDTTTTPTPPDEPIGVDPLIITAVAGGIGAAVLAIVFVLKKRRM